MDVIVDIWNAVIIQPMINSLVLLYSVLFNNFGLSIISFTVIVRGLMYPLTVKQSRQVKAMGALQPELKKVQERYKGDKSRVSQETMKLYRDHGLNPLGCLGPMFIQFPIWIGLYQSVLRTLPSTPESLVRLSGSLYSWLPWVHETIPIDRSFLWLDLAETAANNPVSPLLPVLVGGSMFVMQKMSTMPSADARQASTNRMMLWMMPLMFGFFTFQFPAGLALYWIVSNVVGIMIQGFVTGWDPLTSMINRRPRESAVEESATAAALVPPTTEETEDDATDRNGSQDGRRSNRNRPKGTRRRTKRSRNRHR